MCVRCILDRKPNLVVLNLIFNPYKCFVKQYTKLHNFTACIPKFAIKIDFSLACFAIVARSARSSPISQCNSLIAMAPIFVNLVNCPLRSWCNFVTSSLSVRLMSNARDRHLDCVALLSPVSRYISFAALTPRCLSRFALADCIIGRQQRATCVTPMI